MQQGYIVSVWEYIKLNGGDHNSTRKKNRNLLEHRALLYVATHLSERRWATAEAQALAGHLILVAAQD